MIASLPMYFLPELQDDYFALWFGIRKALRERGIESPELLTEDVFEPGSCNLKQLFFSQTCGAPFREGLSGHVSIVGTPDYGLENCAPGYYRSAIMVRREETASCLEQMEGRRLAVNEKGSWSGHLALQLHANTKNIRLGERVYTGSHRRSVEFVASGRADFAAIDAISLMYSLKFEEDSPCEMLRTIEVTEQAPGLPYIAPATADSEIWYPAIRSAIRTLPDPHSARLGIRDLVWIPEEVYLASGSIS